jgi:hypothetical protein
VNEGGTSPVQAWFWLWVRSVGFRLFRARWDGVVGA